MNSLADDLLTATSLIAQRVDLPPIREFRLAPNDPAMHKSNNFAALLLKDGTVGITYVALDNAADDLAKHLPELTLAGRDADEIAQLYAESEGWKRALGLAAINAISQFVLTQYKSLKPMPDNLSALNFQSGDKVGMVGYFSRLVEPLRAQRIPVTVIELDESLVMNEPGIEVTLDTQRLANCNKVIITGTTLLNYTLENILRNCKEADIVMMLGPSASCLPDPLFKRGISFIGGFHVTSPSLFKQQWSTGRRWRDAGIRYAMTKADYPGLQALLDTDH